MYCHWAVVIGNYYVNYQNVMLLTYSDTKQALSCLQIPPRENWFQYVRRLYATAINFPCIKFLITAPCTPFHILLTLPLNIAQVNGWECKLE